MQSSSQGASRSSGDENSKAGDTPIHVLILQFMSRSPNAGQYQVHEICLAVDRDEHDIMRALYILEGHKLVTPFPVGDFTSKIWHLTEEGSKICKKLSLLPKTL